MLISFEEINNILLQNKININGCFHIGAHDCEELNFYDQIGLKPEDIIWIDAIPSKVDEATNRGIPNVYNAVITDKNDEEIIILLSEDEFMFLASVIGTRSDNMQVDILSLTVLHVCNMLFPCKRRVKSRLDNHLKGTSKV